MSDNVVVKKNRRPKRLTVEDLKERVNKRHTSSDYRGVLPEYIKWDTLRYDSTKNRQIVDIKTVDKDGNPDGNTRTIATSDMQHVRYSEEVSKEIQKEKNNKRRSDKRKEISK